MPTLSHVLGGLLLALSAMSPWAAHGQQDSPRHSDSGPIPQAFSPESPSLRFEQISLEDGLAQVSVWDIMQDSSGFLWIGTEGGLHRYDGHNFELFTAEPFDTTSLSRGFVRGMDEAQNGDLWVATNAGGLNRLDPETGRAVHYRHRPGDTTSLASDVLGDVIETEAGDVWVATVDAGLDRLKPGSDGHFIHYRNVLGASTTLSADLTPSLKEDPDGHVWVSTANGASRVDPETGTVERFFHEPGTEGGGARVVYGFYFPPETPNIAWLATSSGLVRLNYRTHAVERFRVAPSEDGLDPRNRLRTVVPDPQNPTVLWAAGPGAGVVRFDVRAEAYTVYRHDPRDANSLSTNYALTLFADRSGMMWVGTKSAGVNKFSPGALDFSHLRSGSQGLAPGVVYRGLYEDRTGTLWAASWESSTVTHLTQFDPQTGRSRHYSHNPSDPHSLQRGPISALAEDPSGHLWVGHWGPDGAGLSRIDRTTGQVRRFQYARTPENRKRNAVNSLLPTAADPHILWVGSKGGLSRLNTRTGQLTHVPLEVNGTKNPYLTSLHEDTNGTLWARAQAGSQAGLVRIDDGRARVAAAHDPTDTTTISSNFIFDITERDGEPGILWLGTQGGGLNRYDTRTGTARHYTEEDGLANNTVYAVLEDERGTLWLSTNGGISNFDPETETFENFGLDDGLISLEYNGYTFDKGRGGTLYFGSPEGITAFVPEQLEVNETRPQVAITGLQLFNDPIGSGGAHSPLDAPLSETGTIALAHDQNQLTFSYAALHFDNPEKNKYAYRLVGYEEEWVEAGTRREATYTNLPPGDYRFTVKAANSDGVWSNAPASVALRIAPPWWRTWPAYLGYVLLMVGGLSAAFYGQRRRLERRQRELEETVDERTSALRREKQKTEEQAERLREMDRLKSRFFTNVSHEFRTPLTLTIGPLEDVQEALEDDGRTKADSTPLLNLARENIDLALRNSRRLLRLIGQLLDIAKLDAGELRLDARRADLAAFVRDVARTFVPLAERKEVRFAVEAPEHSIPVSFDPDKVEQIVTNLLSNAFKFTPSGGTIHVAVTHDADGSNEHNGTGAARIRVRDSGPGIPPDEQSRLFERFYQAEETRANEQPGTGIGLSLAKDLAELHGGTITVESTVGIGTTFTVRLPVDDPPEDVSSDGAPSSDEIVREPRSTTTTLLAPGTDGAPDDPSDETSMPPHSSALEGPDDADRTAAHKPSSANTDRTTLLIADDNAEIRTYLRSHFDDSYRILEAADGRAALDTARSALPDLIISDVMMPEMDGFELVDALRANRETDFLPVILLTARATEDDKIEGLQEGADAYLTKPFNVRELQTRVETLIASRERLKEHFAETPPPAVDARDAPDDADSRSESEKQYLNRVREVAREHVADDEFGVEDLADAMQQSRSTLYRRLRDTIDETPTSFLRSIRLEQAASLLRTERGTVSEVAYAVGFKSVSHFSKTFRDAYDVPPSAYLDEVESA